MADFMKRFISWSNGFGNSLMEIVQDPRFLDLEVNKSALIFITVLIGIFSVALYANIMSTTDVLKDKVNAGVGSGAGVVSKPGSPPIPPPDEVISLRVYPIKSCRGFEIESTRLKRSGLTLDRNWMFVNAEDRKFLTIRGDPSMTLIDTEIVEQDNQQMLKISIHGKDKHVVVPAFPTQQWLEENTNLTKVEIWEQETDGWEYGADINRIFCEYFEKEVRLIYKGPTDRMVAINGKPELYGDAVAHHFADVMSVQVASEASINDLNRRLGHAADSAERLTIERFRPNIVIRGRAEHPWEEDTWKRIRVSTTLPAEEKLYKLDLDVVARCARCQVPNVDPDTAEKHPKQPWDTLMQFRRVDQGGPAKWKPCFGMMCVPKNEGIIQVGARLECLETTDNHLYSVRAFKDL